jgi:hypothetical protein
LAVSYCASFRAASLGLLAASAWLLSCNGGREVLAWQHDSTAFSEDSYLPWYGGPPYYAKYAHGPNASASADFFPISVWMQDPSRAADFQAANVNFFTGLWQGPTEAQLAGLTQASMPAICEQAGVFAAHLTDPAIRGWLQSDQPDDAQQDAQGNYQPCLDPSAVVAQYQRFIAADATRPVMLQLGRGLVDPNWEGRGSCAGQSGMYAEYVRGGDLLATVLYPINEGYPIEWIAQGVDTLQSLSNYQKPVVAVLEASHFVSSMPRPTPAQIRAEVWLALTHGAAGIEYYCHALPQTTTDCLDDAVTRAGLTAINREVASLAAVLNTQAVANGVTWTSSAPISTRLARRDGATYLFTVGSSAAEAAVTFTLRGFDTATAEVLGENRTIPVSRGVFSDDFTSYAVHLYVVRASGGDAGSP